MNVRKTAPALAAGLALGGLTTLVGSLAGFVVPWQVTIPAGLVAGALVAAGRWLPAVDPQPTGLGRRTDPTASTSFGDLSALRFAVELDSRDPDRFERRLRARLTDIAVERLWQRHRLDWRTDAGRAAAMPLLGADLIDLLTAPPHTLRPSPGSLTRWTRALEDL